MDDDKGNEEIGGNDRRQEKNAGKINRRQERVTKQHIVMKGHTLTRTSLSFSLASSVEFRVCML